MPDESLPDPPNDPVVSDVAAGSTAKKRNRQSRTPKLAPAPKSPEPSAEADRKARRTALFPASSFDEALVIPNAIQKHASGQQVRRLTLFDQMGKSPDSGPSRQLITNANKYGLIKGNYASEHLELTPEGRIATGSDDVSSRDRFSTRFTLAIVRIAPFKALYEALKGGRVPASSVIEDLAKDRGGLPAEETKECVELFLVNAKSVGILKPIAGAERIIPIEQVIEELPSPAPASSRTIRNTGEAIEENDTGFGNTCFTFHQ